MQIRCNYFWKLSGIYRYKSKYKMVGNVSSIGPSSERVFIEPNKITEMNTVYGEWAWCTYQCTPKGDEGKGWRFDQWKHPVPRAFDHSLQPIARFCVKSVCFKMYESEYTTRNTCSESQIDVWFCKGNYHRELKLEFVKWLLKRGGCLWLLKEVLLY